MPKSFHIAALAAAIGLTANVAFAADTATSADAQKPAATVNGIAIPQARMDLNLKAITQQGQPDSPELRRKIRDELIDLEVIAQEAHRKGLDAQPEIAQIIEITKENILRNAFAQDYVKTHPISDDALKAEYEKQKQSLIGRKEYKVAHILVESEKEAQAIVSELKKKPASFDKIAKAKSKDPGSKAQGGELGWTNPAAFVQPFGEAIVKLNKGQISSPVQTQFGWHVIKLEDVRDLEIPPFDKVKATLEKRMQQMALMEAVKALRANAKVE